MSKNNSSQSARRRRQPSNRSKQRRLSIRSELLREPDVHKIGRAIVALALAQAEKEAAEQASRRETAND